MRLAGWSAGRSADLRLQQAGVVVELLYEFACHLRCGLPLRSGRKITLEALDQRMT
jgi:hypothetical protein